MERRTVDPDGFPAVTDPEAVQQQRRIAHLAANTLSLTDYARILAPLRVRDLDGWPVETDRR